MIASILSVDNRLLGTIQRRVRCTFLDKAMPIITSFGTCGIIWGIIMAIFLRLPRYRRVGLIMLLTLALCALITNLILKPIVARPRPCHVSPEVPLLIPCPMDYSFPSGHTVSSFAAAVLITFANPLFGIFAFPLAAVIAFSRLYLFVHYPSDVLAGSIFGTMMACSMLILFH